MAGCSVPRTRIPSLGPFLHPTSCAYESSEPASGGQHGFFLFFITASLRAIRVSVLAHLRGRERGSGFLRGHLARCQRRDTGTHARHRRSPMSGRAYHPPPYSANRPHAACQSKRDRRDLSSQGPPRLRLSAGAICSCGGASGAYVFAVRCADRVSRSAQGSCYVLARSLYAQPVGSQQGGPCGWQQLHMPHLHA